MKYIFMQDFGGLPKGTIVDEKDEMEIMLVIGKDFFEANKSMFQPLEDQ